MGLGSRTARRHLTAKAVEAASAGNETYWDFKPGQRVMTCDGFPGVVAAVNDGPFAGSEEYEVKLDGGLGGGAYTASQLRTVDGGTTAAVEKTAADDYPELGTVLVDRPDIAINTVLGSKTAADQTALGLAPENGGVGDYSQSETCPRCGGHRMLHSSDGTVKCENCGYMEGGDAQTGADTKTSSLHEGHVIDDLKTKAHAFWEQYLKESPQRTPTPADLANASVDFTRMFGDHKKAVIANGDMQEALQRKTNPFAGGAACKDCGFAKYDAKSGDHCPLCDGQMSAKPEKYASSGFDLLVHASTDPSFRFSITASWADVRSKAKRLRTEGNVKITAVEGGQVVAHVTGDHGTYETLLQHHLGSHQAVSAWNCGCAWAKFAWGRSGEYRRYEGRMCSHALATQFEVMSRKMFGGDLEADDAGARLASFVAQESPVAFLVQSSLAAGDEAAEVVLALRTAGIDSPQRFVHLAGSGDPSGMSTGEGIGATGDPVSTQGPTSIQQPNDNPASTGWASGPDPADWGQASNFGRMGAHDPATFEPEVYGSEMSTDPDFGAEATLNLGEPEGALPTTDGGEDPDGDVQGMASHGMVGGNELEEPEDGTDDLTPNTTTASLDALIADFQATAGRALMESGPKGGDSDGMNIALAAKMALKDFSPAEQQALINEGATEGVTAANLDRLDIAGTHYEALEAALASASDDDDLEF